ncbi:MAG: hypothetical protein HON04_06835 [Planctomicrobium sp.]|nr:hypothetical protein [Planctomicrobium sp.]
MIHCDSVNADVIPKGEFALTSIRDLTDGFSPGHMLCVHANSYRHLHSIKQHTTRLAAVDSKDVADAGSANWSNILTRWIYRDSSVRWLSLNSQFNLSEAQAQIAASPIPIHPKLSYNAGDPRKLLGIMAMIGRADLLMYDTLGNSPAGMAIIHSFVSDLFSDKCVIHFAVPNSNALSHPCPPGTLSVESPYEVPGKSLHKGTLVCWLSNVCCFA